MVPTMPHPRPVLTSGMGVNVCVRVCVCVCVCVCVSRVLCLSCMQKEYYLPFLPGEAWFI